MGGKHILRYFILLCWSGYRYHRKLITKFPLFLYINDDDDEVIIIIFPVLEEKVKPCLFT